MGVRETRAEGRELSEPRGGAGPAPRSAPPRRAEASTGERPLPDAASDRRFWLVHGAALPALFLAGALYLAVDLEAQVEDLLAVGEGFQPGLAAPLAALLLQFASGGALTAYFRPAVLDSLAGELGARLDYGWFPRGLHRVSSSFVLFFTLLHASRVFFTGGQLRPRELTWLSGLSLAPLGSAFGVSGYTLPWDSAGPWALQVVSAIPAPLDLYRAGAGTLAVQALRGGPALGQPSLSRCFLAHTLLLPFFILPALALHLALVRKAGVSGPLQPPPAFSAPARPRAKWRSPRAASSSSRRRGRAAAGLR